MYFQNVHNVIYWPNCGDKRNKRMRKQRILENYYKMNVRRSRAVLQLWSIKEDLRSDMWSVKSCQFNQQSAQSQAVQIISGPLQNDNITKSVVFIGAHSSGNSKHYKQLFQQLWWMFHWLLTLRPSRVLFVICNVLKIK